MKRRDTLALSWKTGAPGREDLRGLLRKPWVQLVLLAAAGMQGVAVHGERALEREQVAVRLAPVVVQPARAPSVTDLWRQKTLQRESQRLAAEYRQQGYDVSAALALDIQEAAREHGIEPKSAFGLVRAESSFRNVATSRVGAVGLTQLMPATARWLEPGVTRRELRDPETNLRIGFRYLKDLIEKYDGDIGLALTAYNRGPGTVDRLLRRGRNPDNGYADFVLSGKRGRHRG